MATSSTGNLLTLVTHLQEMENSLTDLMLETVAKLAAMTETKYLLVVETNGRRRFCGSGDLVETLVDAIDVESGPEMVRVDVDVSAKSLTERKRKRPVDISGVNWASNVTINAPSTVKRPKLAPQSRSNAMSKMESQSEIEELVIDSNDDDEFGVSLAEGDDTNFEAFIQPELAMELQGAVALPVHIDMTAFLPEFSDLAANELFSKKLLTLESLPDPRLVYVKGTAPNKIFTSVLYDFGKELAIKSPFVDVSPENQANIKNFFNGYFDKFSQLFFKFHVEEMDEGMDVLKKDKGGFHKPGYFMKNQARSGYQYGLKRKMNGNSIKR